MLSDSFQSPAVLRASNGKDIFHSLLHLNSWAESGNQLTSEADFYV